MNTIDLNNVDFDPIFFEFEGKIQRISSDANWQRQLLHMIDGHLEIYATEDDQFPYSGKVVRQASTYTLDSMPCVRGVIILALEKASDYIDGFGIIDTEALVQLDQRFLDDLYSNNYFGSDQDAKMIEKLWITEMENRGFNLGDLISPNECGHSEIMDDALTAAINMFEGQSGLPE